MVRNLVLAGGGFNAYTILGGLDELHSRGDLDDLECLAGASAGAILSVFLALGITPREICDFPQEVNAQCLVKPDPQALLTTGNFLSSEPIRVALTNLLGRFPDIVTLEDIRTRMGKDVTIVATDLETGSPVYFDADTAVQHSIVDLLMASASLPLVFEPAVVGSRTFWDGCVSDPLPIQLYPVDGTLVVDLYYETAGVSLLLRFARMGSDAITRMKHEYHADYRTVVLTKPTSLRKKGSVLECSTADKLSMFLSGQQQMLKILKKDIN
uniref:PNPLA domain-containing protein n=1 Tax=viral metagenome TaxID=1070528 RepID=A0A6C0KDX6_9ZZZZ